MTSGYLKRTCVRVVLFAHLMQIFTPTLHASDTDYQYRLKIKTLDLDSEKYRVEVSRRKKDESEEAQVVQRLDMEQGKIKDHFIRHSPEGQGALYSKFTGAVVKTYEAGHNIRFVYDIPGFGQIQMLKGGKAFLTQDEDNTSLLHYDLKVKSTGDLLISHLRTAGLALNSLKTELAGNIVTECLEIKHEAVNRGRISGDDLIFDVKGKMINEGAVALNLLCGNGLFINHRELNLIGNAPFLIIRHFLNETKTKDHPAILSGHKVTIGNTNEWLINDVNSHILVDHLSFHGAFGTGYSAAENNRDVLTQKITNRGNLKSTIVDLSHCVFDNSGSMKTASFEVYDSNWYNYGNGTLHVNGPAGGLFTAKESVIQNNGELIVSSGEQGKSYFTQESGQFLNKGLWEHTGDINLGSTYLTNTGTMAWQNGSFASASGKYDNRGSWTLDKMACSQPLEVTNHGILHLKDGQLTFARLINEKNIVLSAGQYLVTKEFQNNDLMSFLENKWTFTEKAKSTDPHRLVLNSAAFESYNADGKIESEKRLKYDVHTMPKSITANKGVHFSKRHKYDFTLKDLKRINTPGRVVIFLSEVNTDKKYKFPNIGHLDLTVDGDCEIYRPFLVPTLTLNVNGELTCGSDKHLATIAGTKGPLTVNAHSIDGKYAKFYGNGPTVIKASKGDIEIGAPQSGGPFLYRQNGSYIASAGTLVVETPTVLNVNYGQVMSAGKQTLSGASKIINTAGDISCMNDIHVSTSNFSNTRGGTYNQPVGNWTWAYSGCYNVSESSDQALLRALGTIHFKVDTGTNLASSILAGKTLMYKPYTSTAGDKYNSKQPATFTSVGRVNWAYGCNDKVGYQQSCSPCGNYPSTLMAGQSIKIGLDGFVISGKTNSPLISIQATDRGYFGNTTNTRTDVNVQEPIVVNLTKFVQEQARRPGFMKIDHRGEVRNEFPMGIPFIPASGDVVLLQNPEQPPLRKFPINPVQFFNPICGIDLDLFLQQIHSLRAGQVYAGKAKGNKFSKKLWGNAGKWSLKNGRSMMTEEDLAKTQDSMLLMQPAEDNTELHTLLVMNPKHISRFQSDGDTVCDVLEECKTGGNLDLVNNRLVILGEEDTHIESGQDINMQTTYHTNIHNQDGIYREEQVADPQQMIWKPNGSLYVKAKRNMTRIGSHVEAGKIVDLEAETGQLDEDDLLLRQTEIVTEKDEGILSSSEKRDTNVTHSALPTTTIAGSNLRKKAGTGIHSVAPQDYAEGEIHYDSPNTIIEGLIALNHHTAESTKSNGFSEQSSSKMQESAFALPANLVAKKGVRFSGEARANVNFTTPVIHDETESGIKFVSKVVEVLASGQSLTDSPLCSVDAGFKAGYETMIPCMLMVEKIIRSKEGGEMLFESVLMDDHTEIIGNFVKTTYELKQWQTSWCHVKQVVPNEVIIAAAIAITILTKGAGAKVMAPLIKGVTAATGMALSTTGVVMVNAGFSAFCAAATSGFLRSGDPLQVAEQMVSLEQLKSIGISMASAGLCSQLGGMLDVNMEPGIKDLSMHLKEHALRTTVDTVLNVAINHAHVDEALTDAVKQIPLRAVAAYAANQICCNINEPMGVKAAHTVLGGLAGFAMEGNRDGLVAGATGALAAQVVGDILMSDAYGIADTAIAHVNEQGLPLTPENIDAAIQAEVAHLGDLAKISAVTVAALLKKDPNIALFTAGNTMDNDINIRQSVYVMAEMRKLLQAAAMAEAAQRFEEEMEEEKPASSPARADEKGKEGLDDPLLSDIRDAEAFADDMSELADRLREHVPDLNFDGADEFGDISDAELYAHGVAEARRMQNSEPEKKQVFVTFADPELGSHTMTWDEGVAQFNNALDQAQYIPNPFGMAAFAASTGRDVYQSKTTVGDTAFSMIVGAIEARLGIKALGWVGKHVKVFYRSGKTKVIELTYKLVEKLKQPFRSQEPNDINMMWDLVQRMRGIVKGTPANNNQSQFVKHAHGPNHTTAKFSNLTVMSPMEEGTVFINGAFVGSKDQTMMDILKISEKWIRHDKAPYVIAVHGSEQGVSLMRMVYRKGESIFLDNFMSKGSASYMLKSEDANWRVLANLIKKNKVYNPENNKWVNTYRKDRVTVLFSCHGGGEGFAQNLANALGPVLAPNKILHIFHESGRFTVAGEKGLGSLAHVNLADYGKFQMFYPGNRVGQTAASTPVMGVNFTGPSSTVDALSKKLNALRNNPKGDWHIADLQFVAERYGITYRQNSTSHVTFSFPNMPQVVAPARKPIKPVYIRQFMKMVDKVMADQAKK